MFTAALRDGVSAKQVELYRGSVPCRVLKGVNLVILRLKKQTSMLMLFRVMSVSDRKARSRAIPVLSGLDHAPPSFQNARPPNMLDVLQVRFRLHRGRCPGLLYLTYFGKAFYRRRGTFFFEACGNERAEDYDGLVGKGNILGLFNCGCYLLLYATLLRVGFEMLA